MIKMKRKNFLIMFDVPLGKKSLARKIQRRLNKVNAKMIQQSVWKSDNLNDLAQIAQIIKQEGGQVTILKEEIVMHY